MLLLLCIQVLSDKVINEIMPPISQQYKLVQTKGPKYSSIDECLLSEISLPKFKIQDIIDQHKNDERWKIIKDIDLSENLKDINQTLTEDERFAIVLYSSNLTSYFYTTLSYVLNTGTTGSFNCYFQYLLSGFEKLKNLDEKVYLFRGVQRESDLVHHDNYKLNDIVQTTSFTSTSENWNVSMSFAAGGILFNITGHKNPKNISKLSFMNTEEEILYPPLTKFKVVKEAICNSCYFNYNYWYCYYDVDYCYYYKEYVYIQNIVLEEIDEVYGPIYTEEKDDTTDKDFKYAGVPWFGWLIIGVACGAVLLGIIWIIVSVIKCKSMINKESANENSETSAKSIKDINNESNYDNCKLTI